MALAMVEGAERDGLVSPGDTIVEYTGGSTGPALALVCRAKGYRPLIVIADCFTEERFELMRALGAELDVIASVEGRPTVTPQDIENMVARAAELANSPGPLRDGSVQQPVHHPRPSRPSRQGDLGADERSRDGVLPGAGNRELVDGRVRGAPAARRLRPGPRAGGLPRDHDGARGSFAIQGWTGLVMPHWSPEKVDAIESIADDEAIEMTRRLASEEGVFAGISTGANVVGAHRLAERLGRSAVIVTLAVDSGFKYLSVAPYADL